MNIPRQKVNMLIKKLHKTLISDLSYDPLKIKKVIHNIFIHLPWDEWIKIKDRKHREKMMSQSTFVSCYLDRTPRIGETISLEFMDQDSNWDKGCVHEVEYVMKGDHLEIMVHVHPTQNEYYRWIKLKGEYDLWERLKRERAF